MPRWWGVAVDLYLSIGGRFASKSGQNTQNGDFHACLQAQNGRFSPLSFCMLLPLAYSPPKAAMSQGRGRYFRHSNLKVKEFPGNVNFSHHISMYVAHQNKEKEMHSL